MLHIYQQDAMNSPHQNRFKEQHEWNNTKTRSTVNSSARGISRHEQRPLTEHAQWDNQGNNTTTPSGLLVFLFFIFLPGKAQRTNTFFVELTLKGKTKFRYLFLIEWFKCMSDHTEVSSVQRCSSNSDVKVHWLHPGHSVHDCSRMKTTTTTCWIKLDFPVLLS